MADPKKSYNDIITWAKGTSNDIIAKQLATARTISITNNSGTALASGTFNGTGNLTLKLPATVGIDISGNAATATTATTAEKAYIPQVQQTDSALTFAVCLAHPSVVSSPNFHVLATAANTSSMANSGLCCIPGADVAANTEGTATLVVGNALAKSIADNRTGNIRIYGNNTGYTTIKPGNNTGNNTILDLPATSGTLALTDDVTIPHVLDVWKDQFIFASSAGASGYVSNGNTVYNNKYKFFHNESDSVFIIAGIYTGSTSNTTTTITWSTTIPAGLNCIYAACSTIRSGKGSDGWNHVYNITRTSGQFAHDSGSGFYYVVVFSDMVS